MYIAPNVTNDEYKKLNLDDSNSSDWARAIDIFKSRISVRYLEPVDLLIKDDEKRSPLERRYGFTILAIDCLLIETLQSFREGLIDIKGKSKKIFIKFLTERQNFKDFFTEELANMFYKDIRCGILHQAETMGDILVWSVGEVIGKRSDGTLYVNRTILHELIKKEIELYCNELKNKENAELRKNFRRKMDFIARKEQGITIG